MIKDLLKMISQHIIFPVVYKVNCMKPINKKFLILKIQYGIPLLIEDSIDSKTERATS